ncbi:MAG TPA: thiamine phosphate synthase [Terriglobales bacterium]|nr:thiamine phosphate synthase [Terriglobales bacterium]
MDRRPIQLPHLYAIIDAGCFAGSNDRTKALVDYALELATAGVTLMQYRAKELSSREILSHVRELRRALGERVRLVMNDRADLCLAAGFDGVHVGQDDLAPVDVRHVVGDKAIVGYSTHNPQQVLEADAMPVDYIAVGPVFATSSKANPDPVIGLKGVRTARQLTAKPLVAIGGITRTNCREVIDAGADSIAVISDLFQDGRTAAEEYLRLLAR